MKFSFIQNYKKILILEDYNFILDKRNSRSLFIFWDQMDLCKMLLLSKNELLEKNKKNLKNNNYNVQSKMKREIQISNSV